MLTDCAALLAAIRLAPDDDTLRLIYADAIQEAGDEARAELVRVQMGAVDDPPEGECMCCRDADGTDAVCSECKMWESRGKLKAGIPAIIDAIRWRQSPECEACRDTRISGYNDVGMPQPCSGCRGANCLSMRMIGENEEQTDDTIRWEYAVTYHRGTKRVACTLSDVCEQRRVPCERCKGAGGWQGLGYQEFSGSYERWDACAICAGAGTVERWLPTPWAMSVCRWHPDVTEFALSDREPSPHPDGSYFFWTNPSPLSARHIPYELFKLIGFYGLSYDVYPTAGGANLALARAVCRWVHSHLTESPA